MEGAGAAPMRHGDYLDIVPNTAEQAHLVPLAAALVEYERRVIAMEISRVKPEEMSEAQKRGVERVLARDTGCVRDAEALPGPFPLVLYHNGAGSSFEDNALLCEEIARSGYVVIGGPFFQADGGSFNVDAGNAGREFEFLLRVAAAELPQADVRRAAVVGHSLGAQASLAYAAQPGLGVDAVVSLDTTQDYHTAAFPLWEWMLRRLRDGRGDYTTPTLFAAGPSALFELGDTLSRSERLYLTMPGMGHNDYISQGEDAARLAAEVAAETGAADAQAAAERADRTAERGRELRRLVRCFLDAKLKGDGEASAVLEALQKAPLGAGPRVEAAPVGAEGPDPGGGEVTPRTVLRALKAGGAEAAIDRLKAADRADEGTAFLRGPDFALELLFWLADQGRTDEAKRLADFYLAEGADVRPGLVREADFPRPDRAGVRADVRPPRGRHRRGRPGGGRDGREAGRAATGIGRPRGGRTSARTP
jgi:pimeloyl-ACP methyl ester carboxylesterase